MHPEHPDPEAEILWMWQPGIKGIRLRSYVPRFRKTGHQGGCSGFHFLICYELFK